MNEKIKDLNYYLDKINELVNEAKCNLCYEDLVSFVNNSREIIHYISPFKNEPIDLIQWVPCEEVTANDYNPNKVAPPEMELLRHSIFHDGYTQPVVTWLDESKREVIDGFHRTRVCKEYAEVNKRVNGYLPVVTINQENSERNDRIASTIRHNRARGKHQVDSMSDIVVELKRRNWKNSRICKELGMDEEEVLRLCQITGLQDLFKDADFSRSWDIEDSEAYEDLTDDISIKEIEDNKFRTVNTSDPNRIFHTYEKWECYKHGFYATKFEGKNAEECEQEYCDFLSDKERFSKALDGVIKTWKNSCEHYLTNNSMNRIAWLGQAAMCYATGIPSKYKGGFNLLDKNQQDLADKIALDYLNIWLKKNGFEQVTMNEANPGRQSTIY